MGYKKIKDLVEKVIEPSIDFIKSTKKRGTMPFKDIESILKILFPKTKYHKTGKGFFKHVFAIHFNKKKFALKMGRSKKDIRKDYTTYTQLCKRLGEKKAKKNFAKIYWRTNLFILQKYGRKARVPDKVVERLKAVGFEYGLRDIGGNKKRKTWGKNIMKFGNQFKIVDAERR